MKRFFYTMATMFLIFITVNGYLGYNILEPEHLDEYGSAAQAVIAEHLELGHWMLPDIDSLKKKQLDYLFEKKSLEFVLTAFSCDEEKMSRLLAEETAYILLPDGAGYIRYINGQQHVEGYLATNRKLEKIRHKWYVEGDRGTITSGVELLIKGEKKPQVWFIHFKKASGHWKIYMLENGV